MILRISMTEIFYQNLSSKSDPLHTDQDVSFTTMNIDGVAVFKSSQSFFWLMNSLLECANNKSMLCGLWFGPRGWCGTSSVRVVGRLPGTHWLLSWWVEKRGSKVDIWAKRGLKNWLFPQKISEKGGSKIYIFPSALKRGVYTTESTDHPHIMNQYSRERQCYQNERLLNMSPVISQPEAWCWIQTNTMDNIHVLTAFNQVKTTGPNKGGNIRVFRNQDHPNRVVHPQNEITHATGPARGGQISIAVGICWTISFAEWDHSMTSNIWLSMSNHSCISPKMWEIWNHCPCCFMFESANWVFLKMFHGTQYIDIQMIKVVNVFQLLPTFIQNIPEHMPAYFVNKVLYKNRKHVPPSGQYVIMLGRRYSKLIDRQSEIALLVFLRCSVNSLVCFKQTDVRGTVIHTMDYTRVSGACHYKNLQFY